MWDLLVRAKDLLERATTVIPLADALIVLTHGGTKAAAFGINDATAGVMLIISVLLLSS